MLYKGSPASTGLFWGTVVISAMPLTTRIFVSGEEKNDLMNI